MEVLFVCGRGVRKERAEFDDAEGFGEYVQRALAEHEFLCADGELGHVSLVEVVFRHTQ